MRCEECRIEATAPARGWRALRTDIPQEGDEPSIAFYCPVCAEREFGPRVANAKIEPERRHRFIWDDDDERALDLPRPESPDDLGADQRG